MGGSGDLAICSWMLSAAASSPADDVGSAGAPAIEAASERITGEVIYTATGEPVTLFHYFSVAPDCGPAPAHVTVIEPPEHGQVRFADGLEPPIAGARPLWSAPDPRTGCLSRMVATRDATYAPDPGFSGHDRLAITFDDAGGSFTDVIEVNVERLGPPDKRRRLADKPGRRGE